MERKSMQTAKIFTNGRSQAVRLPSAFRFEGNEVFIRRDVASGDVILSARPQGWEGLLAAIHDGGVPDDFLGDTDRAQPQSKRDPLEEAE